MMSLPGVFREQALHILQHGNMGNKAENSKELTKKHVLVHGFENKGKFPREYRNTDPPGKPSVIKFRYGKIADGSTSLSPAETLV
jgi:hypothetical protein